MASQQPRATPVLLPGNMCDARLWTAEVRAALPGAIDADATCGRSIVDMAAHALDMTDGPLLAVGFSMGAIVAVEMAVVAPQKVRGLVLIGYNATADLPERAAHRPVQQEEVRAGGLERVIVEELKPNYLARANRGDADLLALLRNMGLALGPAVFLRQSEALRLREDRREALAALRQPVLYAVGEEDTLCPPEWHREWAARSTNSQLFIAAGAGHMLPLEQPRALADAIGRWTDLHQKEFD